MMTDTVPVPTEQYRILRNLVGTTDMATMERLYGDLGRAARALIDATPAPPSEPLCKCGHPQGSHKQRAGICTESSSAAVMCDCTTFAPPVQLADTPTAREELLRRENEELKAQWGRDVSSLESMIFNDEASFRRLRKAFEDKDAEANELRVRYEHVERENAILQSRIAELEADRDAPDPEPLPTPPHEQVADLREDRNAADARIVELEYVVKRLHEMLNDVVAERDRLAVHEAKLEAEVEWSKAGRDEWKRVALRAEQELEHRRREQARDWETIKNNRRERIKDAAIIQDLMAERDAALAPSDAPDPEPLPTTPGSVIEARLDSSTSPNRLWMLNQDRKWCDGDGWKVEGQGLNRITVFFDAGGDSR